jgi:hypothetical protein
MLTHRHHQRGIINRADFRDIRGEISHLRIMQAE